MLSLAVLNFILATYSNATQLTYSLIGLLAMARSVICKAKMRKISPAQGSSNL